MSRISIDVTDEEHRILKAKAALRGVSLKELLLRAVLIPSAAGEDAAMDELVKELDYRIAQNAKSGPTIRSVGDIFQQAYREARLGANG